MRTGCAVVLCSLALDVPAALAEAVIDTASITVRVYDSSRHRDADLERALAVATPILTAAGIDVSWVICAPREAQRRCATPLQSREFTVRMVRGVMPSAGSRPVPLGDAHIDERAGGVLATVYVDRVQQLAGESRIDGASLLGRTIAHELGHLLLASRVHSKYGLMRSQWSREEVSRGADADWRFTPQDIRSIRARLPAYVDPNIVWATE